MAEMHQTLEKALTVPFPGNYKTKLMYSIINTSDVHIYNIDKGNKFIYLLLLCFA
jgi:hypothetical protein